MQACLPIDDPGNYLKFLESYCKQNNIVLIFDEIITGVRSYKFSIQNNYSINLLELAKISNSKNKERPTNFQRFCINFLLNKKSF